MTAEQLLLSHGVKPTPQRVVIADYLLQTQSHPTADDVMLAVAYALPVALSRATVYNTLNTLKEAGVIKEVLTEPGRVRYDANITHHHHFVDVKSGKIVDIPADKVEAIGKLLGDDYKVHGFQVLFYGEIEGA
ncbi:MAG: transcriptional repressor [Candidatus Obscuribacter sp.]|nr:transcriptional repressor [Candidatus Obscuribacter sp.]